MTVPFYKFTEKLSKDDMLRIHFFFLCIKKGFVPEKSELEILILLYNFGEINSKESNMKFLKLCVDNKLRASIASARNVLSKYTSSGILVKEKNSSRKFNNEYIAKYSDFAAYQYIITNYENRS